MSNFVQITGTRLGVCSCHWLQLWAVVLVELYVQAMLHMLLETWDLASPNAVVLTGTECYMILSACILDNCPF